MYRKIIVGYDGSERAEDGLSAREAAGRHERRRPGRGRRVPVRPPLGRPRARLQGGGEGYARQIERAAASVDAEAEAIPSSSAGRGLHALADELGADLIVVGSSHRSRMGQVLAGNVGMSLLHGSPCSVAVAPHGFATDAGEEFAEIVVGYDGSEEATMVLAEAIELARASDAPLKLVTVAEPPVLATGKGGGATQGWNALKEDIEDLMRVRLEEAIATIPHDVRVTPVLASDEPATALARIAQADGALLMLGSRAYGPLRRVLMGTVATALARIAPCPLIFHPRPAKSAAAGEEVVGAGTAAASG